MHAFRALLIGTCLGTALTAAAADAQMLRSADNAASRLYIGAPQGLDAPRRIGDGETVWTERVYPMDTVRLSQDAPERNRPRHADAVPAGAVLFGIQLSDEAIVYCEPVDYDANVRRVQCLRDIDGNGTFDGGYLSRQRGIDSQFVIAFVHALQSVDQVAYETIERPAALETTGRVRLEIERDGPVFVRTIDEEEIEHEFRCSTPGDDPTVCDVLGVRLRVEPDGDAYRISLIEAPEERGFIIQIDAGF